MWAVKFIINHEAVAAKTLHKNILLAIYSTYYKGGAEELNKVNPVFFLGKGCILKEQRGPHRNCRKKLEAEFLAFSTENPF
jgi:hypothetical protein